jgi:hypothetical protein
MATKTDDEVKVTTDELRKVAKFFDGYGNNMLTSIGKLKGLTITPGTFEAANSLKAKVDECVSALVGNVTALGNAYHTVAENLTTVAKDYDDTNDDNVGDADRLNPLVVAVNKELHPNDQKK